MWRIAMVVWFGCGRIAFDPQGTGDAAVVPQDSVVPFDRPFGAPQMIAELATSFSEDDPSLTGDLLEIYFSSRMTPQDSVWRATRASVDDRWSPAQAIAELNMGGSVNNPKVTLDGLTLYFGSSRAPSMGNDIWKSTRPDRASPWSAPMLVTELQSADDDYEPYELPDHLTLYFTRNPSADAGTRRTTRATTTSAYGPAVWIAELDVNGYDGCPFVTADELGMLFNSQRGGSFSTIYRATRASASDPFGTPTALAELDMARNEEDAWLSPDGRVLVFSADPTGTYDLYIATR